MNAQPGLRELKKRRAREEIAAVAHRLFATRGFDAVTVADVARAAQVAPKTVFNYFPTKEDLFYSRADSFGGDLVDAVRNRPDGTTILDAFRRFVLTPRGVLAATDASDPEITRQTTLLRVALESPALLAREKQVLERYSRALGELIAEETGARGNDIEPKVVADALIAVHRALIDCIRPRLVAGEAREKLLKEFHIQGEQAFRRLEEGLGAYARR
jgi:AcrR family transcriptional regulator